MVFAYDERLGCWRTTTPYRGRSIALRLFDPDLWPERTHEQLAALLTNWADDHWTDIEELLVSEFLVLCNTGWRDAGAPELDRARLLSSLLLTTMDLHIEDVEEYTTMLYFDDSGLFAGHGIQLEWDLGELSASLVG